MEDYIMKKIVPKLVSPTRTSGRRSIFTVIDDHDNKYTCFNKYLRPGIKEGKGTTIRLAVGKNTIISVEGFYPDYPNKKNKPPKNKAESELFNLMESNGWELSKKGWPDFACFKDGKLVLIEVKPKRSHRLKSWQHKILLELVKHDIKCYRWSPDGGFEPIMETIKFPIDLP